MSFLAEARVLASPLVELLLAGERADRLVRQTMRTILRLFGARTAAFHGTKAVPEFLRFFQESHEAHGTIIRIPPGLVDSVLREGGPWKLRCRRGPLDGLRDMVFVIVADGPVELGAFSLSGFPAGTFEEEDASDALLELLRIATVAIARSVDAIQRHEAESEARLARTSAERAEDARKRDVEPLVHRGIDPPPVLIGDSLVMREHRALLERASASDVTVCLTGETGTGKEVAAQVIHHGSRRRAGPFHPVVVTATTGTLFEPEFYGSSKGSFTGSSRDRAGHFECADRGTLSLDEIGEISEEFQVKLLRPIESRRIRRVGEGEERPFDVRLISATHCDLFKRKETGHIREDFYYRLHVMAIRVPALRDRGEDIRPLAEAFLRESSRQIYGPAALAPSLDSEGWAVLMRHSWPGNVRELKNVVQKLAALDERRLGALDVAGAIAGDLASAESTAAQGFKSLSQHRLDAERSAITDALRRLSGNLKQVALALQVGYSTLCKKVIAINLAPARQSTLSSRAGTPGQTSQ